MLRDPHASLALEDEVEFAFVYRELEARRFEGAGFRIGRRRGEPIFARRRHKLVPLGSFGEELRQRLSTTQPCCTYCKRSFGTCAMTLEHRQPVSKGGTWKRRNLTLACERCNQAKADLPEETFRELIERCGTADAKHAARRARKIMQDASKAGTTL